MWFLLMQACRCSRESATGADLVGNMWLAVEDQRGNRLDNRTIDGKVIHVHPVRHNRSRELGVFANPTADPAARTPPPATLPGYQNSDVVGPASEMAPSPSHAVGRC